MEPGNTKKRTKNITQSSFVKKLYEFCKFFYKEFMRKFCFQRAAALAYSSLLALVPLAALSITFVTAIYPLKELAKQAQTFLLEKLAPQSAKPVNEFINSVTAKITGSTTAVNIFGFTGLIITAIALFITIEEVMNAIWEVKIQRSIFKKILVFWALITLGPVFLLLSIAVKIYFESWKIVQVVSTLPIIKDILGVTLALISSWLGFFIIYKLVPNTKIKIRCVLLGSFLGAFLWEISKLGFAFYVSKAVSYRNLYGSLGAIPIFLIWIYITWVIILGGMIFTYCWQNLRWKDWFNKQRSLIGSKSHDYLRLKIMYKIGEAFLKGENPLTSLQLSETLDIPTVVIDEVLMGLLEDKLISTVKKKEYGYQPARAADRIYLTDIATTLRGDTSHVIEYLKNILPERFSKIEQYVYHSAKDVTLRDLLLKRDSELNLKDLNEEVKIYVPVNSNSKAAVIPYKEYNNSSISNSKTKSLLDFLNKMKKILTGNKPRRKKR